MKVQYKVSIKTTIDNLISTSKIQDQEIEYIHLSQHEYIQFLEEIGPTARIVLNNPFTNEKTYKNIHILVPS